MNLYHFFRDYIHHCLDALVMEGTLPEKLDYSRITVEPPKEKEHGDISTNAALVLAKLAKIPPRELAEHLKEKLATHEDVASLDIAGPGFINLTLTPKFWQDRLKDILNAGTSYGCSTIGKGQQVNVEYVSVNPTGPMHAGHGRGAVFGDVLASLLKKIGHKVTKEYYINDAGGQSDTVAKSVYLRYLEATGEKIGPIPEGLYPGEYLIPIGHALAEKDGLKWKNLPESEWLKPIREFAVKAMMDLIRRDLDLLGVHHDVFSSELKLVQEGRVDEALKVLEKQGLLYTGVLEAPKGKLPDDWEPRPQLLFKSTEFGDDVDRPLKKSDGSWTYFAKDIAYHFDKYKRSGSHLYNVWGADHGGYVKRVKSATQAITEKKGYVDVSLCQMVKFLDKGVPVKMSKRADNFIPLQEVIEKVGKDVFRLFMLTRKNDAPLEFDYSKVLEKSHENPVFYIQYAHARAHSVKRQAKEIFPNMQLTPNSFQETDLQPLTDKEDLSMMKKLASWPRQVETAAEMREPHRLAYFLYETAGEFHSLWNKGKENTQLRFILSDNKKLTQA
ncbi:MAG: arginine--tRNA ligase, partial [Alphaproteobacteria bacterium]|nr:arginine--tRNA ligase [Alphaproteobacteria bacterium]